MMNNIIHLENISEINGLLEQGAAKHPLAAVIDFSKYDKHFNPGTKLSTGFYIIMFKNYCPNKMKYGRQFYDFQEGSLICIAPKQVITLDDEVKVNDDMMGWGVFFHPDLIRGTTLGKTIKDYSFFAYETNEALHLSEKEKQILFDCVKKIEAELLENLDMHSQKLIVSNIELLLNYCDRYYDRQFITRKRANKDLLIKVEEALSEYVNSRDIKEKGLPTVKYLANKVGLSPSYLSDLLKKETGMTAQDHIHHYLVEEAKNLLLGSDLTVSELAYTLGFEYPQYFSRLFRSKTGMVPSEYRNQN